MFRVRSLGSIWSVRFPPANGPCLRAITRIPASARSRKSIPAMSRIFTSSARCRQESPMATKVGRLVVEQHDVHGHAISQQPDRARSDQARLSDEMDLRAPSGSAIRRHCLLRCRQPRRQLCGRQDHLQPARRTSVAVDAETGHRCGGQPSATIASGETMTMAPIVVKNKVLVGDSGGEVGRARQADGARREDRQNPVARLQHRTGQGRH